MKEVILDTETTGLDPFSGHRIIEIGAVKMYNKVPTGAFFHFYLNPERDVPKEAEKIHGLSTEFLQDKPLFSHIADEFLEFIQDSVLVIHNASFDMKFLNHEFSRLGKPSLNHTIIDTLMMARKKFPGAKVNLDALCSKLNIDNSNRAFHGALKDAKLLAEVYIELCGGRQAKFETNITNAETINISYKDNTPRKVINTKLVSPTAIELELHEKLIQKLSL